MSLLRIIFALPYPNPFQGGAGWTRTSYFGKYFLKKGYCVTIAGVFSIKSLKSAGFSTWNGLRIANIIPSIMMYSALALVFNILSSFVMSLLLFLFCRPDVLVISVPNGDIGFGCYIAAKVLRIHKIFFDYRDNWEDFALKLFRRGPSKTMFTILKHLMEYCYRTSNGVIAVTPVLMDQLRSREITNLSLITNGADLDVFRPRQKNISRQKLGFRDDDFMIVHNGLIGGYYKLDITLEALKQMKLRSIKLIIIGSGSDVPRILKLVEDYGLKESVFYFGSISDPSKVAKILSACDLGLVPYDRHDSWHNIAGALPVKVFEYSACGLPVLATTSEYSLLGRFIISNDIGIISDPENVNDLIKNILSLYTNKQILNDMGARSLSIVTNYDRKKIAQQLFELIEG